MTDTKQKTEDNKLHTVELKNYDVVSAGRVIAGMYGIFGAVLAIIYFLMIVVVGLVVGASQNNVLLGLVFGILIGLLLGALFVGFYVLVGFLAGVLGSALYNVVAKKLGGIKMEVKL
jgi:hypothetical protein